MHCKLSCLGVAMTLLFPFVSLAQPQEAVNENEFFEMSLEELLEVEVYSVTKKEQKVGETAAAVYVITDNDIKRSGAQTIAELLRMVPGLRVAQFDNTNFSVSSRGFGGRFANNLLVLLDGRSMYTSLFGGVYWNTIDVPLGMINRIEVIRGPGGTTWGANAVNGVINIITKDSRETTGVNVSAGGGTEERYFGSAWGGEQITEDVGVQLWAKHYNRDESQDPEGGDAFDQADGTLAGIRADIDLGDSSSITVSGGYFDLDSEISILAPSADPSAPTRLTGETLDEGAHFHIRGNHKTESLGDFALSLYYLRHERETINIDQREETFDFEFRHTLPSLLEGHTITWGGGYRGIDDELNSGQVQYIPSERYTHHQNIFIQDAIEITDDLNLLIGSKFEENYYSGMEIQPSARLNWNVSEQTSIWAAYSRAVRTPTRVEEDIQANVGVVPLPDGSTSLIQARGNSSFEAENLNAFELGTRLQLSPTLNLDLAAFYFDYDDFLTVEPGDTFFDPDIGSLVTPILFDNLAEAESYGGEATINMQPSPSVQLQFTYSFVETRISKNQASRDTTSGEVAGFSPEHQATLRSYIRLMDQLQLNTLLRYIDSIGVADIDAYLELDAKLAYQATNDLEIALVGQNLLDGDHLEFRQGNLAPASTEQERGVYGELTYRF